MNKINKSYIQIILLLSPIMACATIDTDARIGSDDNLDTTQRQIGDQADLNIEQQSSDTKSDSVEDTETETDNCVDGEVDCDTDTDADTIVDTDADTNVDTNTNTSIDEDTALHQDSGVPTSTDSEFDTNGHPTDTDGTEVETSVIDTDTVHGESSDPDTVSETDPETETETETATATATETASDTGTDHDMYVSMCQENEDDTTNEWYRMQLQIQNDSSINIPLKDFVLRYYYTIGHGEVTQSFNCWNGGCADVIATFHYINLPNADYYLELRFEESDTVIGRKGAWDITFGLHVEDADVIPVIYTFDDDWSYSSEDTLTKAPRIVLYSEKGATRIWGEEP